MSLTGKKFSELTVQQQADMRDAMRGYKVYRALIYINDADVPIVTELENTIPVVNPITWTNNGTGIYGTNDFGNFHSLGFYVRTFDGVYVNASELVYFEYQLFGELSEPYPTSIILTSPACIIRTPNPDAFIKGTWSYNP